MNYKKSTVEDTLISADHAKRIADLDSDQKNSLKQYLQYGSGAEVPTPFDDDLTELAHELTPFMEDKSTKTEILRLLSESAVPKKQPNDPERNASSKKRVTKLIGLVAAGLFAIVGTKTVPQEWTTGVKNEVENTVSTTWRGLKNSYNGSPQKIDIGLHAQDIRERIAFLRTIQPQDYVNHLETLEQFFGADIITNAKEFQEYGYLNDADIVQIKSMLVALWQDSQYQAHAHEEYTDGNIPFADTLATLAVPLHTQESPTDEMYTDYYNAVANSNPLQGSGKVLELAKYLFPEEKFDFNYGPYFFENTARAFEKAAIAQESPAIAKHLQKLANNVRKEDPSNQNTQLAQR